MLISILMVNLVYKKKIKPIFKYLLFCVLVMRASQVHKTV